MIVRVLREETKAGTVFFEEGVWRNDPHRTACARNPAKDLLTFEPSDGYSFADMPDCFITDIEDALDLWGIPYTRDEKAVPLPAWSQADKAERLATRRA